jgi:hypothetical protein
MLPSTDKMLPSIPLSRVTSNVVEVTGDHQCGFRRDRSTNDQIFCIRQSGEKNGIIMGQYLSYL